MWETSCGNAFTINDGTPAQNDMKYCCYCGGEIEQTVFCEGCRNEIGPGTCGCGDPINGNRHDGHFPVPMGCDCFRESSLLDGTKS